MGGDHPGRRCVLKNYPFPRPPSPPVFGAGFSGDDQSLACILTAWGFFFFIYSNQHA